MGGRRGRLISAADRKYAIELIKEALCAGARTEKCCKELGISQRTLQRWRQDETSIVDRRKQATRPAPQNKLTPEEKQQIIAVVNQPEFSSLPPSQIVPALADAGIYLASESSFYRILRENNRQHHRGKSKKPEIRPLSTHRATGPNQVWMWDITWLPAQAKGLYFYLYLILDLYSRKIVGWEVWEEESAEHASELIRRSIMAERLSASRRILVLHSDNGSPMKGATFLETLYQLGITPSRSRPRVSNDNPYAESVFRTCKYRPGYPSKGFGDIENSRQWTLEFVNWYNTKHHHSGLKFITPEQRHTGQSDTILQKRRILYHEARSRNPTRWSCDIRNWELTNEVWLNPEKPSLALK